MSNKVRVLHTSDWHLGKKLFKSNRIPEQELFLNWLYDFILVQKIDLLLVAGDIFDVPTPPTAAQKLFYDFVFKLGKHPEVTCIIIAGNHDSNSLLKLPQMFFESLNCHIFTGLENDFHKANFIYEKNNYKIGIKCLPYFRNYELLNIIESHNGDEKIIDEDACERFFSKYFSAWKNETDLDSKILLSHHVFGNYEMSGSEHAIFLSGMDHFPLPWVKEKFDYIALGHIHKRMALSEDPGIIYPGSPIPMRFSESNKKSVSIIEIDKSGTSYEFKDIPYFRRLEQIKVTPESFRKKLTQLISNDQEQSLPLPTYLEVLMVLEAPTSGLADEIRTMLESSTMELLSYIPQMSSTLEEVGKAPDINQLNIEELFSNYYQFKFGEGPIPSEINKSFHQLIQDIMHDGDSDENS